jgi:hypothetical protein
MHKKRIEVIGQRSKYGENAFKMRENKKKKGIYPGGWNSRVNR